jgi:hypothetical protein
VGQVQLCVTSNENEFEKIGMMEPMAITMAVTIMAMMTISTFLQIEKISGNEIQKIYFIFVTSIN